MPIHAKSFCRAAPLPSTTLPSSANRTSSSVRLPISRSAESVDTLRRLGHLLSTCLLATQTARMLSAHIRSAFLADLTLHRFGRIFAALCLSCLAAYADTIVLTPVADT